MNKDKYYVFIRKTDGNHQWQEVDGTPAVIPGFEGLDLFSHKNTDGPGYRVTEGKTGSHMGQGPTALEAVQAAGRALTARDLQATLSAIHRMQALTGLSPRYRDIDIGGNAP
jgi:hypothetical protein